MPRQAIAFAAAYLDITSRMNPPPPSEVIQAVVEMANANPSDFIAIAPNGQLVSVQGEFPEWDRANDAPGDLVWVDYDRVMAEDPTALDAFKNADGEIRIRGLSQFYPGAQWICGPNGIRDDIWPVPLHNAVIEAYKSYSLFGIGDEHDILL